jgi:hypothetical protein
MNDSRFSKGDLVLLPPDGAHGEQRCHVVRITTGSVKLACLPGEEVKRRTVLVSPQSEIRILRKAQKRRKK